MGLSDLVPYLVIAGQLLILFKVFSTFYLQVLLSPQGDYPPAKSIDIKWLPVMQVEQRWIQGGLLAVLAFQLWRKFGQSHRQRAADKEEWV